MEIVFAIIVVAVLVYFVVIRKGNYAFWQKVQRYPDIAYDFFLESDCWYVEDGINDIVQPSRVEGEWDGPFLLNLPNGPVIKVWGKVGFYEESEKELDTILTAFDATK